MKKYLFLFCYIISFSCVAQTVADSALSNKYCSRKIEGLSPSKVVSLGYDFVGNHQLETDYSNNNFFFNSVSLQANTGLRFLATVPIINNQKALLSFGINYLDFKYHTTATNNNTNPFIHSLLQNGLRSYGSNLTLYKPFNHKYFGIFQAKVDFNSAGSLAYIHEHSTKYTGAIILGMRPHNKLQLGLGISRSYRGGALAYFPLVLYNHTFKNKKWGIEMLLPSKANLRYTVNDKNLLFVGIEMEGNSYYINPMVDNYNLGYTNLQLHRSELRPRLTYERGLYKTIWLSVQAGYCIGYKFNVDETDYIQKPYVMENKLGGSYYFNVSLNLVSP